MIDTSKKLKNLTIGEIYTATEDCIFVGAINTKPTGWWDLKIDGVTVCGIGQNGASNCSITFPNTFLKAGSTIQIIGTNTTEYFSYSLTIFGVK